MVIIPYKDPEKARQNKREYHARLKNDPEYRRKRLVHFRNYQRRHKIEIHTKRFKKRDYENVRNKKYSQEHKEELNSYYKQYRIDNKEKIRATIKKWEERNPDKVLAKHVRYLTKLGTEFDVNWHKYGAALLSWARAIRKQTPLCFCGQAAIHSHHIIHKSKYPGLSLNLGNGIGLCLVHHNEVHGINLTNFEKVDEVIE